jgi:prolyl-tRNA editing enzyme YbaK/EbsC (Cys-tRNA(Pro) deacylase)
MALDKAKKHLEKFGFDDRIIIFDESTASVKEAAHALGCSEGHVAKTLSFLVDDKPILIVTAGDTKIDNAKYRHYFKKKAKMISYDDVLNTIGHEVGGVCPFGINDGVVVYLDESLKKYDKVYPAAGTGNSAVSLTVPELEKCSCYLEWIDVCKK